MVIRCSAGCSSVAQDLLILKSSLSIMIRSRDLGQMATNATTTIVSMITLSPVLDEHGNACAQEESSHT